MGQHGWVVWWAHTGLLLWAESATDRYIMEFHPSDGTGRLSIFTKQCAFSSSHGKPWMIWKVGSAHMQRLLRVCLIAWPTCLLFNISHLLKHKPYPSPPQLTFWRQQLAIVKCQMKVAHLHPTTFPKCSCASGMTKHSSRSVELNPSWNLNYPWHQGDLMLQSIHT